MTNTKFDFKNKVALVTGAAAGIGKEVARYYALNGAKLVLSDVNSDLGEQAVKEINEAGGEAKFISCDVSQTEQVERLIQETVKTFGKLNIVCNNAGIEGKQAPTPDCTFDNWDRVIDINLKGVWLSMKYQIPELIKAGGGSIVNLSSIAGLIGFPGLPAYVASKHGVVGLSKTAALEYAKQGIRVNAVCPGPIKTEMLQRLMDSTPGFQDAITAGVPMGSIGSVENVAETVAFLSSEGANYITGQALAIDGGWVSQ